MNPDCLIPILEHGDLLTWAGAAAAVGAAWLGLFAMSKYLGNQKLHGLLSGLMRK